MVVSVITPLMGAREELPVQFEVTAEEADVAGCRGPHW